MIDLSLQFPFPNQEKKYIVHFSKEKLNEYPVVQADDFSLSVTFLKENKVEISGEGKMIIELSCDRCLKPVPSEVEFVIDETCNLNNNTDADEEPVFFIADNHLDEDELIQTYVLSNLPAKVLCKEDCKGICFTCGADLNIGPCACEKSEAPTRMAELLKAAIDKY